MPQKPTPIKTTSEITVKLINQTGGDNMIVAAAKVSTVGAASVDLKDADTIDHARGLIDYLIKHRHGTPFEHGQATFYVHAPIFVWREWHRHRVGYAYSEYGYDDAGMGMSFNEESGRYKTLDPVFYLPPPHRPMFKVDNWKPGKPKFTTIGNEYDEAKYQKLLINLHDAYQFSYGKYEENLELGFDPGVARACLNVGIFSGCWVTCNPRSLMSFLSLRIHDETAKFVSYPLYEIEVAARVCEDMLEAYWPMTYRAYVKNGRVAP